MQARIWTLARTFPAALLFAATALSAQMHHVDAPERVTRAIGVYEWTGDLAKPTASRLVPVSLFIYNHFEDAGLYLSRPVPFALDPGNVYEIEKAGEHEGTLDLDSARNLIARGSAADESLAGTWYGFGKFALPGAEPKPKALKPVANVAVIEGSDDDSRPHLARRAPPSVPAGTKTGAGDSSTEADKPTMQRRTPATGNDDYDPERPTLGRRNDAQDSGKKKKKEKPQASVSGPEVSLNDDPERPTMRRGKPANAETTPGLVGLPAGMHQAIAVSDPANREPHLFAREWESSVEQEKTLAEFQALARMRVAAYIAANQLQAGPAMAVAASAPCMSAPAASTSMAQQATDDENHPKLVRKFPPNAAGSASASSSSAMKSSTAAKSAGARSAPASHAGKAATPCGGSSATSVKAAPAKSSAHTTAAHTAAAHRATHAKTAAAAPLALTAEQLNGYTLSYGGQPTFVYTAESPVAGGKVYVTLIAQRLPSGELQVSLGSVTDTKHLDRTPWMRFVDVVDPDAEHRASFLFELRAENTRQFALYRLVTAEAKQIFVTGTIE